MIAKDNELPDILIVDDDSTVVMTLNKALCNIGRIRFASNATQAFSTIEDCRPNLILLDVELPDLSGMDVCAKLKEDADTQTIPVLFITSHTEVGFEEKVFDAGAADYISKPLNPRVVAARVQTHLNYHRAMSLLEKLAHTDGMTNLANRRTFDELLITEWKRTRRGIKPLTIALIDIDEFKKYNDHYGHLAGDDCIKEVALALSKALRRPADIAARYGGEEFAFILPNTAADGAEELLSTLLTTVEQLKIKHAPSAHHPYVTISIGYSTVVPDKKDMNDLEAWALVAIADHALYNSKRTGRNRISYEEF